MSLDDEKHKQQKNNENNSASLHNASSEDRQPTRRLVQEVIIKIEMNNIVQPELSDRKSLLDRDKSRSEGSLLDANQNREKVERSLSDSGVREIDLDKNKLLDVGSATVVTDVPVKQNDVKIKNVDDEIPTESVLLENDSITKSVITTVIEPLKLDETKNDEEYTALPNVEESSAIDDKKIKEKENLKEKRLKLKSKSCLSHPPKTKENVDSLYDSDQILSSREYNFDKSLPQCACKCIMVKDKEYHDLYCPSDRKPAAKSISAKSSGSNHSSLQREKKDFNKQSAESSGELVFDENGLVKINWKKVIKHLRSSCPSKKLKLLQAIRWVSCCIILATMVGNFIYLKM